MTIDLLLAIGHHLAVFTLVGIIAAEFVLLRPGLAGPRVGQLARIDAAYGAMAGLVVVVGILRVIYGAAGWDYYAGNHAFWAKMAAFVLVGLLSIKPSIAIRQWHQTAKGAPDFAVPANELASNRRFIHYQLGFLVLIPIFAAIMARG